MKSIGSHTRRKGIGTRHGDDVQRGTPKSPPPLNKVRTKESKVARKVCAASARKRAVAKAKAVLVAAPGPRTEAEERFVSDWNGRSTGNPNLPPKFTLERTRAKWSLEPPDTVDRQLWTARVASAFGNSPPAVQKVLMDQLCRVVVSSMRLGNDEHVINAIEGAVALLHGIAPQDTLEAMLATQMVAVQEMAMDQLRKASLPDQPADIVTHQTNRASRLMRLFTLQMNALQHCRGKGPSEQVVRVEHVTVEAGAQAVIGSVTPSREGHGGPGERIRNA